jgi:hypothetical protein
MAKNSYDWQKSGVHPFKKNTWETVSVVNLMQFEA